MKNFPCDRIDDPEVAETALEIGASGYIIKRNWSFH
jgi:hypothetical protein